MFKLYIPNEFGKKKVEEYKTREELNSRLLELAKEDLEGADLDGEYYEEGLKDCIKSYDWEEVETVYSIYDRDADEVWSTSYLSRESAEAAIKGYENVEIFEEDDLAARSRRNDIKN